MSDFMQCSKKKGGGEEEEEEGLGMKNNKIVVNT